MTAIPETDRDWQVVQATMLALAEKFGTSRGRKGAQKDIKEELNRLNLEAAKKGVTLCP